MKKEEKETKNVMSYENLLLFHPGAKKSHNIWMVRIFHDRNLWEIILKVRRINLMHLIRPCKA